MTELPTPNDPTTDDTWGVTLNQWLSESGSDRARLDRLERETQDRVVELNVDLVRSGKSAEVFTEDWSDAVAWNVGGTPVRSGGHISNMGANHGISLQSGERFVAKVSFRTHALAGTNLYIGVNNDPAGGAMDGSNANGAYYGTSGAGLSFFRGTNLTGTAAPFVGGAVTAGEYVMNVVIDEDWISFTLVSEDFDTGIGTSMGYARCRRTDLPGGPTINNLAILVLGTHANVTQAYIGPISTVRGDAYPERLADRAVGDKTLFGADKPLVINREDLSTSIRHFVSIPGEYDINNPPPIVLWLHGATMNGLSPFNDAESASVYKALSKAGYIVVSSDNGTTEAGGSGTDADKFGNQASMDDYIAAVEYVRSHWANNGQVFLFAESMGTMSALNLTAFRQLGGISGMVSINGMASIHHLYTDPTWGATIAAAYGVGSQAEWDAVMEDYDPGGHPGYRYRNLPIRWYSAQNDTVADPQAPYQFETRVGEWFDDLTVVSVNEVHVGPLNYEPTQVVTLFDEYRQQGTTKALTVASTKHPLTTEVYVTADWATDPNNPANGGDLPAGIVVMET